MKFIRPVAIYMIGSFGRDEGSFCISDGRPQPFRDYDILVVVKKRIDIEIMREISKRIHQALNLPDPYLKNFRFEGFSVWLTQVDLESLNSYPLLKYYELKVSSKLLWGEDIKSSIHLTFDDVSLYNGILILFSKIEGLLALLDLEVLRTGSNSKHIIDLMYECMKTYSEFGTSLCLLARKYLPSFHERCLWVSKNYVSDLRNLSNSLFQRMTEFSSRRLVMEESLSRDLSVSEIYYDTVRDLGAVIGYYLRKAYGLEIKSSSERFYLPMGLASSLNSAVLEDLFRYYLRSKTSIDSLLQARVVAKFYLRYATLRFILVTRKKGLGVSPRILFARNANIMMRLWLIGFRMIAAVNKDLSISRQELKPVEEEIGKIVGADYVSQSLQDKNLDAQFTCLKRILSTLLSVADDTFHQKG